MHKLSRKVLQPNDVKYADIPKHPDDSNGLRCRLVVFSFTMTSGTTFDVGHGLIEIAALTALIGSSTAESLILGSRGAAGLPWAAISAFGSIFLAKACIAAPTPPSLRDTIGVRNNLSEASVGLSLDLNRNAKGVKHFGEAVGVSVSLLKVTATYFLYWCRANVTQSIKVPNTGSMMDLHIRDFNDIYAFDNYTATSLRSCMQSEQHRPLRPYLFMRDPYWHILHKSEARKDWIGILLSLIKVVEVYVLYHYGSRKLCWVTGINWIFFFMSAIIIQLAGYGREHDDQADCCCLDIVAGRLPLPQVIGEERKVLLGVPINVRKSLLWRLTWIAGSIVCTSSLIASYLVLKEEPRNRVYMWLGFQGFWLLMRSIYFHFAAETDDLKHSTAIPVMDKGKSDQLNFRLLALAAALSKYQVVYHPRGQYTYAEDSQNPSVIVDILNEVDFRLDTIFALPEATNDGEFVPVDVAVVIGDTMLSSVAWLIGLSLTGMDLYDSCLLAIRVTGRLVLIPSARVLSGGTLSAPEKDLEAGVEPSFLPRGLSNDGTCLSWIYWIPCGENRWVTFSANRTKSGQAVPVVGRRTAKVMSSGEITDELKTGELLVSLMNVEDVKDIIHRSTVAGQALCNLLQKRK